MLRLLPEAVKAAVRGPELTKTSFGKITSKVLKLHQRVVGAVHCPEGAESSDRSLLCSISGEDIEHIRLIVGILSNLITAMLASLEHVEI